MCSANLCDIPGVCTNDGNPGIAAPDKRDLVLNRSQDTHTLMKRGQDHFDAPLSNGLNLFIIAAIVNAIGQLYNGPNSGQITRQQFRLRPGPCIGPSIDEMPVAGGSNPPGLTGDETEHPLEVSTSEFPQDAMLTLSFTAAIFGPILDNRYLWIAEGSERISAKPSTATCQCQ